MADTKIEWADVVWNPVTGCSKVSPGCANCYAERMSKRLAGRFGYDRDKPFGVQLHPDRIDQPLRWRKPRRVFVCSMGDLFHPRVPSWFLDRVFAVMTQSMRSHDGGTDGHVFIVLTKRPAIMRSYMNGEHRNAHQVPGYRFAGLMRPPWPPGIWLGVSVENQETADKRIPILLKTPAAKRFVSCEPLLGPVELRSEFGSYFGPQIVDPSSEMPGCPQPGPPPRRHTDGISWVIVGGESGPGARPMHPDWARSLRDQCAALDGPGARIPSVPFFFKQMGPWDWRPAGHWTEEAVRYRFAKGEDPCDLYENWHRWPDGSFSVRYGTKGGRMLDGCIHDEVPR